MASLWTGLYPIRTGVLRSTQGPPEEATMPAEILRDAGYHVAGMDQKVGDVSSFAGQSQFPMLSWDASEVPAVDLCVHTPALDRSDPILRRAAELGAEVLALPEFLAQVFADRQQVCVAGTHGKSTTTSMMLS